jgi:hypothetical protein
MNDEDTIEIPTEMLEELRQTAALVERGLESLDQRWEPGISMRYFLWCVHSGIMDAWEYIKESKNILFLVWPKTYIIFWRAYKADIEDKKRWDQMTPVQRNYNREELRQLALQVREMLEKTLDAETGTESKTDRVESS